MKAPVFAAIVVASAALLSGCETVSREQCVAGDWVALGRADAAQGHPSSRFEDVAKDCGRHGITPDPQAYMTGWQDGVRLYCTPMNGFTLGRQNRALSPICPPALAGATEAGHRLGRRIWVARDRVARLERTLDDRRREIDRLRSELDRLDCRDRKGDDRAACRDRREELRRRMQDARFELQDARFDFNDRRLDYERVLAEVDAEAWRTIPGYQPQR
jgi:hypothetical protein